MGSLNAKTAKREHPVHLELDHAAVAAESAEVSQGGRHSKTVFFIVNDTGPY